MGENNAESASAYTLDEIAELRFEAEQFKLQGRSKLDRYTYAELRTICNGIGAEWMPGFMRELLNTLSPFAEPVLRICSARRNRYARTAAVGGSDAPPAVASR